MKLAVLGAGSWGLTLAAMLENNFDDIYVWGRKEDFTPEFMETKKKTYPMIDETFAFFMYQAGSLPAEYDGNS